VAGNAIGILGAEVHGVTAIGDEPCEDISDDIADIKPFTEITWIAVGADFVAGGDGGFCPGDGDAVVGDGAGGEAGGRWRGALRLGRERKEAKGSEQAAAKN